MSHTDKDNHAMYSKPWQVALVLDPIRQTFGFFAGPNCERTPHFEKSGQVRRIPGRLEPNQSSLRRYRYWILMGLAFQLGLAYCAAVAYNKSNTAISRTADQEKRLNHLQDEIRQLRRGRQGLSEDPAKADK